MNVFSIGQRIDDIRKARKMSKKELCDKMGFGYNTLENHISTGRFSTEYLAKYAESLGCTVADLTDGAADLTEFTLDDGLMGRYPWNLAAAVGQIDEENYEKLYEIYIPGVLASVQDLTEREQKVIELRFLHYWTLRDTGGVLGVGPERIRQIEAKAIRKLRHPRHWKHWKLDTMNAAMEARAEASRLELENINLRRQPERLGALSEPEPEPEPVKVVTIEDLELSVRSYNCLKRAEINTLADLTEKTYKELVRVRNLGRKSVDEIMKKMEEYGVGLREE